MLEPAYCQGYVWMRQVKTVFFILQVWVYLSVVGRQVPVVFDFPSLLSDLFRWVPMRVHSPYLVNFVVWFVGWLVLVYWWEWFKFVLFFVFVWVLLVFVFLRSLWFSLPYSQSWLIFHRNQRACCSISVLLGIRYNLF